MSRALRKAQKQRLRDPELSQAASDHENEQELEEIKTVANPFDLLNADNSDEDDAIQHDEDETLAKDEQEDIDAAVIASTEEVPEARPTKRKAKNKKKKSKPLKDVSEHGAGVHEDDFDAIIASHQAAIAESEPPETQLQGFHLKDLLSIDVRMLDPDAEMRRIFGSKVVSEDRAEHGNRRAMPRGLVQPKSRGRKSVLVPVEDNYPLNIKGGLEMSMLEDVDGIRTFKFEHSKAYQQTQYMFLQCVQSGDPQTLMSLLTRAPFHVDTLLQVSEIMRHQGDNEQSLEMLTRALFAFDRAFHPLFNIATGMVRLPFEHPENRPFYLAIYRYIQSLGRRGCWSTALEFNKLLYALAPEEDPYAALLSIDFYAIKARRWDYIEQLLSCPWKYVLDHDYPKPNFEYARALGQVLSLQKDDDREPAKLRLRDAIRKFPYFVGSLFNELKAVGPIQFDALEPNSTFATLLRDLYVFRSKDVYNTPELTKFLRDSALPVEDFDPHTFPEILPTNVCRHILLLDERTLLHYLPKDITQASGLSSDPLPPEDSIPSYLDEQLASLSRPSRAALPGIVGGILPRALEDILRRHLGGGTGGSEDDQVNDEEVARMIQAMDLDDEEDLRHERDGPDFADPNGYGANRGVDEPETEGNAGRR